MLLSKDRKAKQKPKRRVPRPSKDQKDKSERFLQAAREHECELDEATFDETLRKVFPPKEPKVRRRSQRNESHAHEPATRPRRRNIRTGHGTTRRDFGSYLEQAVSEVTGLGGFELKRVMRTGTVASVDNRNWEIGDRAIIRPLSQSRAIALDMESAAIAANGFRFRVPYGTLLCVSDKPLHGEIKLAGMAGDFYRRRVGQHLEIGLRALEKLKSQERERLHSRKLRSIAEVAFQ